MDEKTSLTDELAQWNDGDLSRRDRLFALVNTELRRIAAQHMRREAPNHILQTTALVNEAYLKLIDHTRTSWQNRAHFFAIAAKSMRNVLVDHARKRNSRKRGGLCCHVVLDDQIASHAEVGTDVLALNEALSKLSKMDQRKARVVELRSFSGMEVKDIAEHLGVSAETVARDWKVAIVWLRREFERPVSKCGPTAGQK